MKIGVIFTAYNCENYLKDCLSPWLDLRQELDLILTANSGMFKPYKEFGFEEKNEKTLEILVDSKLDFLVTTSGDNLLDEDSSRNFCLEYLKKHNVDLVWVVDGDEVYKKQEIIKILDFIESNKNTDSYKIQFKNYTFEVPYFTKGFNRETIYWTDRNGGVSHFHFDVFMEYNNGMTINDTNEHIVIPKDVSYVEHYSWLSSDSRSHEKIVYQNSRFVGDEGKRCAFKSEGDSMTFNKEFWDDRDMEIPNVCKVLEPYTYDLELSFSPKDNSLYIDWITREMITEIRVYDNNKSLIFSNTLHLNPYIRYYLKPDINRNFIEEEDFKGFIVEVIENGNLIHNEEILINL